MSLIRKLRDRLQGATLHFGAELVGCTLQHQGQLARLFAQPGKHGDQAGKTLLLRQR